MAEAMHFGRSGQALFGLYDAPRVRRAAAGAVLLCYPAVQEYMRTTWAFRKLAELLAREGLHVLRFDYYGTGDSAGESREVGAARCVADVRAAAAELADLADVPRASVIGLRWGAALAAQAVAQGLAVRDLVLWEPAVDGRSHLAELEVIQAARYRRFSPLGEGVPGELMGYPLDAARRTEMEALDLRALPALAAERVLLFAARPRPEHAVLLGALRDRQGRPPACELVPEEEPRDHEGVLLSTQVLRRMAAAVAGGAA